MFTGVIAKGGLMAYGFVALWLYGLSSLGHMPLIIRSYDRFIIGRAPVGHSQVEVGEHSSLANVASYIISQHTSAILF